MSEKTRESNHSLKAVTKTIIELLNSERREEAKALFLKLSKKDQIKCIQAMARIPEEEKRFQFVRILLDFTQEAGAAEQKMRDEASLKLAIALRKKVKALVAEAKRSPTPGAIKVAFEALWEDIISKSPVLSVLSGQVHFHMGRNPRNGKMELEGFDINQSDKIDEVLDLHAWGFVTLLKIIAEGFDITVLPQKNPLFRSIDKK